jgi:phosphoribosyl 1,2-cyclic phosphodiesterase
MRVHVCGVRGSTPAPGPDFVRYGGHTSCLALAHDGETPSLVLDAGTGLRRVSALLDGAAFRGAILLGHLHWDHTQGLPFFSAGDRPEAQVRLAMPAQGDAVEVFARFMSPPHFPVDPLGLRGQWSFEGLEAGEAELEGFSVLALDIPHKGGRTFGFRVTDGTGVLAYLSDHNPVSLGPGPEGLGPYHESALRLARGADFVFHDAQHTAEELPARAAFGHSAAEYVVGLAEAAGARSAVLFHHDPNRTDDELDVLVGALPSRPGVDVRAAKEGETLDLGRP